MKISNCIAKDLDAIFELYAEASKFQKSKQTVVVWPEFDRSMVRTEIEDHRKWKIEVNGVIICVWAIAFEDEQIWEERNEDPAIYIHRIATHPGFRGHNYVAAIVDWARGYAKLHEKSFVRLDTVGPNPSLIDYYQKMGFEFLGCFELKNTDSLPEHYQYGPACLFQIDLSSDFSK